MLHHFLSPNSLRLAVWFQEVTGYRHEGQSRRGFQPRWQWNVLNTLLEVGHSRTENTDARWPPSLREMFSNRATHKKKILSHIFVSSSLSTSFILFYVAYQRDLQPRGFAISHGERKVLFQVTIYVPPEQPKQLHFLNPNATGDLTLQSWFSCLYLSRLTFLQAPPFVTGQHAVALVTIIMHSFPSLTLASGSFAFSFIFPFHLFLSVQRASRRSSAVTSYFRLLLLIHLAPWCTAQFDRITKPQKTACSAKHNSIVWPRAATKSQHKHHAPTWLLDFTEGLLSNVFRQRGGNYKSQ